MKIANRRIGPTEPPFIIAEMSGNHNQSLDRAISLVEAAAKAGAHALKLQTYTADTMTINVTEGEFFISDKQSLWKGTSLYDLYKEAYTPWEWHKAIFSRCSELGMIGFSSPFDSSAVDFLEDLDVPAYKIASFEVIDLPLIAKVAATGKPIIMSTGMASLAEIDEAVRAAREAGCPDIALLKCTSSYPASAENSNIRTISHMRDLFKCEIGLSDHTMGTGAPCAAVAMGASIIEKHFTLSRADGGVDSAFSLEPDELKALVTETERAWQSLGKIIYGPQPSEQTSLSLRRSIYVVKNLEAGDVLTEENIRCIRPGLGLAPKYFSMLLGKQVTKSVKRGTAASWDMFSPH